MELIPSLKWNRSSIAGRTHDHDDHDGSAGLVERVVELSSWMIVLATVRLVCSFADYAAHFIEQSHFDPWSFRLVGRFMQGNHPLLPTIAAWPLILGLILRRTRWPELLWAAGLTFVILSVGGMLTLIVELGRTQGEGFNLGSFHIDSKFLLHPRLSSLIFVVLGATQLLIELRVALRALFLAVHSRQPSRREPDQVARTRRARCGRLALYASVGFLVLIIRLPVWSAYLELLNKSTLVREFVLNTDFDRIKSKRQLQRSNGGLSAEAARDPFLALRERYIQNISLFESFSQTNRTQPDYQIDFANNLNNLAWLLVTYPDSQRHDPERAVQYARRAVEILPESGNDWNTLGVAYYRAGAWNESKTALEQSMKLRNEGDSFDWFFLSLVHGKLGHPEEARQWYERAVQWYQRNKPDDRELDQFHAEAARELGLPAPAYLGDPARQFDRSPGDPILLHRRVRDRAASRGTIGPAP